MKKDKVICNKINLDKCPDCKVDAGKKHKKNCDVERCSVCGSQFISCGCENHDKQFSRWTGFWPGELEARALNMDLNSLHTTGMHKIFFTKPK